MPIIPQASENKNFDPVPSGNHVARCYQMIEIGTETIEFEGKKKSLYRVRIGWELPNEKKVFKPENGEQPFVIAKDYTLSLHEKSNLRHDLKSWRGKDFTDDEAKAFDITKLIGVACMLNVIHTTKGDKTYGNISGVTSVPKGLVCPPAINPPFVLSYDNFDERAFALLPDFLKKRIEVTPEFGKLLSKSQPDNEPPPYTAEPETVDVSDLPF